MPQHRCPQRHRDNPQRSRQLHRRSHRERGRAVLGRRSHHRTRVMNRKRGPQSELRLRQMQRRSNRRKCQQRHRIQHEYRAERYRHLLIARMDDWSNRRDRASPANRGSRRNQERRRIPNRQQLSQAHTHSIANEIPSTCKKAGTSCPHYLMQVHSETKAHD